VAAGGVIGGAAAAAEAARRQADAARVPELAGTVAIALEVNGATRELACEPRTTLLDALRTRLEPPLCGTKLVCDRGNCGACTVIVDGRPAYACLLLAVDQVGRSIRTIEGLGAAHELTAVQQAFVREDASMCGFCTPGFVMSITAALEADPKASGAALERACSGNLCRCGTYPHVFAAAERLARAAQGDGGGR
jgi:aerobic-type carbon monoxide dehydrogenase small subunit (CoxS/CutS family)